MRGLQGGPWRSGQRTERPLRASRLDWPPRRPCGMFREPRAATPRGKAVSGDWLNPANWTHGAPEFINLGSNQPTKSACITAAGTYTITVLGRCGPVDCLARATSPPGPAHTWSSSGRQTVVIEGSPDLFPPPPAGHCTGPGGKDGFLIVSGDAVVGSHGSLSFSEQS